MRTTLLALGALLPDLLSEMARLRAGLTTAIPADQRASVTARLDRAASALDARRGYLALYRRSPAPSPWPPAGRRPAFRSIAALDSDMTRQYESMAGADGCWRIRVCPAPCRHSGEVRRRR